MAPPWLAILEVFLTRQLLRSPLFHRVVQSVHKKGHELRHGKDPADMGGTNINTPQNTDPNHNFMRYFYEEIGKQFRGETDPPPSPPKEIDNKPPAEKR